MIQYMYTGWGKFDVIIVCLGKEMIIVSFYVITELLFFYANLVKLV